MAAEDSSESPPDAHDDQEPEHDQDGIDEQDRPAKRAKRSRACQACRNMKIRCLPVEGQEACKACSKVNRACVMPGPARKRQKTVHKVAELEKKIDALTATLVARNQSTSMTVPTPPTDSSPATVSTPSTSARHQPPPPRREKEYSWDAVMDQNYPNMASDAKQQPIDLEQEPANEEYEDVITRGIVDPVLATKLFEHWKTSMCLYCPIVAFSEKVDVPLVRRKRPMTLLSIFVVAAGVVASDLQPDLAVEFARQLADRVMFYNEKSLDLIQAMLVQSTWYGKHKYAKDLGFNHYIHSAVAMCLDLGLGKRSRQQTYSDAEDAEIRRTWMGCYLMAGNVATVLRLPPLVKFSPYMEECLEKLANHPACLPSDALLCCLVKVTHLVQDVGLLFHMDDPCSSIPLNDSRTQYHLKLFERQVDEWRAATEKHLPGPMMEQYEAVVSLYVHEIALHNEHNVDDFRPMYRATGRETPDATKDFLTNAHFEALTICVDSMQRAIRGFLDMDTDMIRGAPALTIVWTAYVAVAMIRLHGVLAVPDSKYGSIFLPKLDVAGTLDAIVQKLVDVITGAVHLPAGPFINAFKKLKAWHVHRTLMQQQAKARKSGQYIDGEQRKKLAEAESQARAFDSIPTCGTEDRGAVMEGISPRTMGSPPNRQQQERQYGQPQTQFQRPSYTHIGQSYQQPQLPTQLQNVPLGTNSTLLDPNATIDASTFDIQNWDFTVGELNNFENYLGDAGWMGYLM